MLRPPVSQSASLSWNRAPIWGLRPDFYYCQKVAGLLMWDALALASVVILGSESRGTRDHILLLLFTLNRFSKRTEGTLIRLG
jgi:hypothetical protein